MERFTNVQSTAPKVEPLEMDEFNVYVNNGITEVHTEPTDDEMGGGFDGFVIEEQLVYEKDEYIALISQENTELGDTVNAILTDIIPSLLG